MSVVALVAIDTGTGCCSMWLARGVTARACRDFMSSVESEVGEPVIKRRFVERDDVCFAAFVIRMTRLAFGRLDFRPLAVKSLLVDDVGVNVLMTFEAKTPLARLRKWLVTAFALVLQLGVRLNHVAR